MAPGGAAAHGAPRHRLDAIGVGSVARVALLFYLGVLAAMLLGIGAAWLVASRLGAVSGFEGFMRSMGFRDFRLLSGQVILGASMIALAVVTMWVVLTVIAACLYNAISLPWGGVHVTLTPLTDDTDTTPFFSDNGDETSGNGHAGRSNGSGSGNGNGNDRPSRQLRVTD
jgi:transmembrane protein DUF3566